MNRSTAKLLHANGRVTRPHYYQPNTVASSTDPTQDIPVKNIQMLAAGIPFNVADLSKRLVFTNKGVESLSIIDRRGTDTFDAVGELQAAEASMHTNLKTKKLLNHETEKN